MYLPNGIAYSMCVQGQFTADLSMQARFHAHVVYAPILQRADRPFKQQY